MGHSASGKKPDPRYRPDRPWAGVVVIVFRGDEFLLTLRAKPPRAGIWGLPGGALHLGETGFAAAIREVREETGILCAPYASFTTVDVIEPGHPDHDQTDARTASDGQVNRHDKTISTTPDYHFLLAAIAAEWKDGTITPASDATDAGWFDLGTLNNVPHFPLTKELVLQALLPRKL